MRTWAFTNEAFLLVRSQYDSVIHLRCTATSDTAYEVKSAASQSDKSARIVTKVDGGGWTCSCNMPIYKGISCRHQVAVLAVIRLPCLSR